MARTISLAKIRLMMRSLLALFGCALALTLPALAQGGESYLLAQTNGLRASRGLPSYAMDASLSAAARNHARWMAANNLVQHEQFDGAGPRTRAQNAGFPTNWVSENIYLGASAGPEAAWQWWLNSPVHYAGLVSPYYDKVGIGSATGAARTAYVMVFGNSTGRLLPSSGGASGDAGISQPPGYVLGLDEYGNIKHEVQQGHTIGDIALFYGYTWDDIPAMLALNGMTGDDIRVLQPGSVFLVPPKAGTYTPTSPAPPATATATAALATPTTAATPATASAAAPAHKPTALPTRALRVAIAPTGAALAVSSGQEASDRRAEGDGLLLILGVAVLVQLGILGGALLALLSRWR